MATKLAYKTTFEVDEVIQPIYTGGSVALDNGSRILATTLGEDVVLTDLATGRLFARIEGDGETISTLILTPSASHLVVCSRSLAMRIYALDVSEDLDAVEPTLLRTLKPHATPAVVLAVDRTSTLLATGAADGNIKVWDIRGGFVTHTFRGPSVLVSALHFFEVAGGNGDATALAPEKDGKKKSKKGKQQTQAAEAAEAAPTDDTSTRFRLASGSQDGKVRVWDLHRRAVVANLDAHVSDVQAIDYSPTQHVFVTAGRDKTIIWWDAQTWTQRRVVPTFELIEAAGFVADETADSGAVTYSAGENGCVRLWETRTGREITAEQTARSEEDSIIAAVFHPAQATLLCVQMDQTLALYPVPSPRELLDAFTTKMKAGKGALSPLEVARRISGTHDDVIDLAFLLPDQSLLALGTNSEDVRIVSVADPPPANSESSTTTTTGAYFGQDVALLKGHTDIVVTLDVDWSGHWIVTGAKDNSARLWRVDASAATAGGNKEYSCYAVFAGHAESVGAVALPKAIPEAGTPAHDDPLNHPPPFLVTGSQDLTIKRWDIPRQAPDSASSAQQRALFTRKAHDKDINALDVDAAGQLFASSSQDRTVKIWSVREGEVQGILRGHRRGVWSVKFAPPGTPSLTSDTGTVAGGSRGFILTGSGDKTVKLWSLADYTCLRTFEGHTNSVLKVAWLGNAPEPETKDEDEGEGNEDDEEGGDLDDDMDLDDEERPSSRPAQSRGPAPVLFASAGGDGLVKVWDAASGEAACTLDNHEDRVWALAVRKPAPKQPRLFVSGGGDATVSFWRDTTASTVAAAAEAAKERVEQEQQLANHMRRGAYREALTLALQLNQPGRLLSVLSQVGEAGANPSVDAALASLTDDQLYLLLLRVRDWNTNGRTATVAQRVLATIVRSYPTTRLSGLAKRRHAKTATEGESDDLSGVSSSIRGANIKDVLDALLAYTERHYKRMAELLDESYLVDYTLQEMDALQLPGGVAIAGEIEDVAMAGAE
ncbi:U3 small nucleolar RNA-associated protein 13 [Sporothrix curviconia]|uniref:U3 small nucleolar RNA-associated protein 13 n=1 Tax=Sporothrix curviconia TaxID=1260050 RepID=A0ABP0BM24_9PEZI